jgi:hypothetical protein
MLGISAVSLQLTMKKVFLISVLIGCFVLFNIDVEAQCSICAKTVSQMGTKPAEGFNTGIIYLMVIPYLAIAFVAYKWWKSGKANS